ncbi:MAG: SRPBCC domain-containing protein [Candidatus Paceibacterota bacterium]
MLTLVPSISINASKEKVWETMLDDLTYREWTSEFREGSHYVGDWSEGSKILFLAPDKTGDVSSGMVSKVKESRPCEFLALEHLGVVVDGKEDLSSEATQGLAGALECYTLRDLGGGITEVVVEMDCEEKEQKVLEQAWLRALKKLKELSEK